MKLTRLSTLAVAAIAVSQLGATDCGEITRDPGFDLWCGDRLCFWKTDKGDVAKVPTWIEGDDGVELVGDDVAISQMTSLTSNDVAPDGCIEFDMTAKIDADVDVELELDLFGDGTADFTQRIPTSDWEKQTVSIGIAGGFEGAKFRLTKAGGGQAIVADMRAHTSDACPPPFTVAARPLGALCGSPDDCDGGMCVAGVCSACESDLDCTSGDVCGREDLAPGWLQDWHTCIAPASRELGQLCFTGGECATGDCSGNFCQECSSVIACSGGETCTASDVIAISMCDQGPRGSGAPCILDADCASGACAGDPVGYCDPWGIVPCYRDADCGLSADLSPVTCTFVAVAGGTCQ